MGTVPAGDCPEPEPEQVPRVVLYGAAGCHLCDRARETLVELRRELDFEVEEVDITGVDELEARYREFLPVVEIDGQQTFVYFVPADAFRRKLAQSRAQEPTL
jgi:glutaredoxin